MSLWEIVLGVGVGCLGYAYRKIVDDNEKLVLRVGLLEKDAAVLQAMVKELWDDRRQSFTNER